METFVIVFYLLILFMLSVYGANRYYTIYLFKKHRHDVIKPLSEFSTLPKVTIQLPVYNEKYVVERLIEYVSKIRYPKELMEIQLLDDSTDETQEIAKRSVMKREMKDIILNISIEQTEPVSKLELWKMD